MVEQVKLERQTSQSKEVPFVVRFKGANEVIVTGDFTGWSREGIRLRKAGQEEFRAALTLKPGEYQYRLIVDGEWTDDPQAKKRVPNPFGGENCVLQIPPRGV